MVTNPEGSHCRICTYLPEPTSLVSAKLALCDTVSKSKRGKLAAYASRLRRISAVCSETNILHRDATKSGRAHLYPAAFTQLMQPIGEICLPMAQGRFVRYERGKCHVLCEKPSRKRSTLLAVKLFGICLYKHLTRIMVFKIQIHLAIAAQRRQGILFDCGGMPIPRTWCF